MKLSIFILISFFFSSCSIYTLNTKKEISADACTEKISEPIKIRISSDSKYDRDHFVKEFTYQLIKKKIKFILVDSKDDKEKGLFIDMNFKELDNGLWRPLVIFLTLAIIPMKIVTTYEVETIILADGKVKDSFVAKSGHESWTQILLLFAGPFKKSPLEVYIKVVEDLANQVVTRAGLVLNNKDGDSKP